MVTLGDQPRVSPDAIRRVIARAKRRGRRARHLRRPAPATRSCSSRSCSSRSANVSGDKGARNLLLSVQVLDVPCDDLGGGEDVDTPAELDALRAGGP